MMHELKAKLRRQAYSLRNAQPDKDSLSAVICEKFLAQEAYHLADTVMWYVHCRSEVRTVPALGWALKEHKQLVVPYCTKDNQGINKLGLWRLEDCSELVPGTWGILEPPRERWEEKNRQVNPQMLDLIMVPGVGFDRLGGRLGNGAGYYDRLLQTIREDALLCGVCFEAQVFPEIPMDVHDVFMDFVITENQMYTQETQN